MGERAEVVRRADNLRLEGDFVDTRERQAPGRGDRAPVVHHPDHLRQTGDFTGTSLW